MRVETLFSGFENRAAAGRQLAKALRHYRGKANAVVIGLPRGGVVTAAMVAEDLDLPLDVLVVRKLGAPGNEELALGAIAPGGVRVLNEDVIRWRSISSNSANARSSSAATGFTAAISDRWIACGRR